MKTLKTIIDKFEWEDIKDKFLELYPEEKEAESLYSYIYNKLKTNELVESKITIHIKRITEDFGEELEKPYYDIYGTDGVKRKNTKDYDSFKKFYEPDRLDIYEDAGEEEQPYALEFRNWDEWLGMTICEDNLNNMNPKDIICHCIFEMTFCGFNEEEIGEQWKVIEERKNDVDKWIADGTIDQHTVSWEDIKQELEEKLNGK